MVVVSAMAGETDRLIGLAKKITASPNERTVDLLLSTGEQVTVSLLAITFAAMGYSARSYCGWQIPLVTDSGFGAARINKTDTESMIADLRNGLIVVVAGFQGVDENGNVTTLGRGGSDASASLWRPP